MKPIKIAAYCRVSTEKESQLDSLDNQKLFFREYAEKNGFELVNIYADEGVSGRQMKKRAAFLRMLDDAEKGYFGTVVVKDISRFARNTVDFLKAVRFLKTHGIDVRFLSGNQTVLGDSEFILTVFGALAQEESANLSKRVKFGKKISAQKGRVPNIIYGYDRVDSFHLKINPYEAETVKRIFGLYSSGEFGFRKIADILNSENIPTKRGYEWSSKTVRRILTNPLYCGELVNRRFEVADFLSGEVRKLPESENFHHVRPDFAIVPKSDFVKVSTLILSRSKEFSSHSARHSAKNPYSTIIKCMSCQSSFIRRVYSSKTVWRCSGRDRKGCRNLLNIDQQELDLAIQNYISDFSASYPALRSELKKAAASFFDNYTRTPLYSESKTKAQKLKDRAKTMFENDLISLEELKARLAQADALLSDSPPKSSSAPLDIDDKLEKFLAAPALDHRQISHLVSGIFVADDGNVTINFNSYDLNPD